MNHEYFNIHDIVILFFSVYAEKLFKPKCQCPALKNFNCQMIFSKILWMLNIPILTRACHQCNESGHSSETQQPSDVSSPGQSQRVYKLRVHGSVRKKSPEKRSCNVHNLCSFVLRFWIKIIECFYTSTLNMQYRSWLLVWYHEVMRCSIYVTYTIPTPLP